MVLESSFGERLRTVMRERGYSYEQLGEQMGMNPQTLNRYVLGRREPKARTATDMAVALGGDPLWLQGYDVPRFPAPPGEVLAGRGPPSWRWRMSRAMSPPTWPIRRTASTCG